MFNVQNEPAFMSGGAFLAEKPLMDTRTESHQGGRKSARGVPTSSTYPK